MPGQNVFQEAKNFSKAASVTGPCVFISHRKSDVDEARDLANTLIAAELNIYFDEDDVCLSGAEEETNPARVVGCIDAGLHRCTHLLGLITERTAGSWWVPYEIGATRAATHKPCAFLVGPGVKVLPAYVKVATLLADRNALANWLPTLHKTASSSQASTIGFRMRKVLAFQNGPKFLPEKRFLDTIEFKAA